MSFAQDTARSSRVLDHSTSLRRWRLLVAARVFTLATALGLAAATGRLAEVAAAFMALCVLAAVMSVPIPGSAWQVVGPAAEAAMTTLILASAGSVDNPLQSYVLVPVFVAGVNAGVWGVMVAAVTQSAAQLAALLASDQVGQLRTVIEHTASWTAVGLGLGLLGSWMRSSSRPDVSEQQRYVSAHRLLGQLHAVARDLPHGLDVPSIAQRTLSSSVEPLGVSRARLLLRDSSTDDAFREVAAVGNRANASAVRELTLIADCWESGKVRQAPLTDESDPGRRIILPLRVGHRMIGVVVVDATSAVKASVLRQAQSRLDEQSLRLESAVLFDRVRSMATVEERHRLAREIHDGIAQEIASLGYLVDDLASSRDEATAKKSAQNLRGELTRIVNELRYSIFDLRMDVNESGGLGQALSDYARDVGTRSGMTVHTALAESGQLPIDVQTELLRIAQEAMTNARKHSRANNLWVTLNTNGAVVVLRVEDDGAGHARPREDHYGLRMMRERADRIGAELVVSSRTQGGTSVVVALQPQHLITSGGHRADLSSHR